MTGLSLPRHDALTTNSRVRTLRPAGDVMTLEDWLVLACFGLVAAVMSTWLDFSLRIPGHAILRAVFPMAAGLALVPRKGAGFVMSLAAGLSATGLQFFGATGHGGGSGAFTSLVTIGPLLDVALWWTRRGWHVWLSFMLSGLAANALAFIARGLTKQQASPLRFHDWLHRAPLSYLACGLIAGLFSGMVWFAMNRRLKGDAGPGGDPPPGPAP